MKVRAVGCALVHSRLVLTVTRARLGAGTHLAACRLRRAAARALTSPLAAVKLSAGRLLAVRLLQQPIGCPAPTPARVQESIPIVALSPFYRRPIGRL